jgi:hypothetical protein
MASFISPMSFPSSSVSGAWYISHPPPNKNPISLLRNGVLVGCFINQPSEFGFGSFKKPDFEPESTEKFKKSQY